MAQLRADIPTNPAQARHGLSDLLAAFEVAAGAGEVGRSDWLALADCFFDLGEFTEAIEIMERVLTTDGPDPMLSFKILITVGRRRLPGDINNSGQRLAALAPSLPQDKDTLPELIRQLRPINEPEAERYEDKWIAIDSDNPRVWLDIAAWALNRANYIWPKGKKGPPGFTASKMKRAHRHLVGAERTLRRSHTTDPWLWTWLAEMQANAGMSAVSAEATSSFSRLDPQNFDVMLRILKLYPKSPNKVTSDELDRILNQLLARESDLASYWNDLATACGAVGRPAEQRAALERCLALKPDDPFARMLLRNLDPDRQNEHATQSRQRDAPDGPGKSATKSEWWRRPFAKRDSLS